MKCKKCGKPVKWLQLQSGKWFLVDVDTVQVRMQHQKQRRFSLVVEVGGNYRLKSKGLLIGERGYRPHFEICCQKSLYFESDEIDANQFFLFGEVK